MIAYQCPLLPQNHHTLRGATEVSVPLVFVAFVKLYSTKKLYQLPRVLPNLSIFTHRGETNEPDSCISGLG